MARNCRKSAGHAARHRQHLPQLPARRRSKHFEALQTIGFKRSEIGIAP
jgi:hypothetical protein